MTTVNLPWFDLSKPYVNVEYSAMKSPRCVALPSLFATIAAGLPLSTAFIVPTRTTNCVNKRTQIVLNYKSLPTIESLCTNDSFTDQTYYAASLVRELSGRTAPVEISPDERVILLEDIKSSVDEETSRNDEELSELLTAQLSHRDGIRGFFAAYLAGEGDTLADGEIMPAPLMLAMKRADTEAMVQTACMNVVISTAMMTIYNDPVLKANSAKMAKRSKKILSFLEGSMHMMKNCEAIVVVATGANDHRANQQLVKLWNGIFKSYGYKEEQLRDIVIAFTDLV